MDGIRNVDVKEQLNQENIGSRKMKRMLKWFGHVIIMDNNRMERKVLEAMSGMNGKRERPRKTLLQQIERIRREKGKTQMKWKY